MPDEWNIQAGNPRGHSTSGKIIQMLSDSPFLTSEYLEHTMSFSASASHRALVQLSDGGIIREITGKKRNRVWVAAAVMDELKGLELRIGERLIEAFNCCPINQQEGSQEILVHTRNVLVS